jgi:hypothetical protein
MCIYFFQDPNPAPTNSIATIILAILGSGVLGALLALLGVYMQNRAQSREKKIDREMTLRRDIYLLGAEAVGKMRAFLAALAHPETPEETLSSILKGVNESIHKVYVVAAFDTLKALDALEVHFATSHQELLLLRVECIGKIKDARHLEQIVQSNTQQLGQLGLEINSANARGESSKAAAMEDRFQVQFSEQKKLGEEYLKSQNDSIKFVAHTVSRANEMLIVFDELAAEANFLVRKELGFDIDHDRYLAVIRESNDNRQRQLKEGNERLLAQLEE